MELSIQPMQWAALPDLGDAPPLGPGDLDCLRDEPEFRKLVGLDPA